MEDKQKAQIAEAFVEGIDTFDAGGGIGDSPYAGTHPKGSLDWFRNLGWVHGWTVAYLAHSTE